MNLTGTVAFAVGALLIYSAVKNKDPRDVIRSLYASGGKSTGTGGSLGGTADAAGRITPTTPIPPIQNFRPSN